MKEVYCLTLIMNGGELRFIGVGYETYLEALEQIKNQPKGEYQIQKVFVKD